MNNQPTITLLPFHWIADLSTCDASPLRVITVGLNPSDREFRANDAKEIITSSSFLNYDSMEIELNPYQSACLRPKIIDVEVMRTYPLFNQTPLFYSRENLR